MYEKSDYVKARLEFKNAAQIDPKYADAYRMLGLIDLKENNLRGAYGLFSKAIELNPTDLESQYQLGKILLGAGQPDKAMEKAELILKKDATHTDGLLLKGAVYVARKEFTTAIPFLDGLIAKGISKPDAFMLLASAHMQKNDAVQAEATLVKGGVANPKSIEILMALADLKVRAGKVDDAAATIKQVMTLEPKEPRHGITLAQLYWAANQQQKAQDTVKGLIAADPQDQNIRLQVAGFYLSHSKPDDAERELKEGIAAIAKNFKLRFALSELYANLNKGDLAIETLKEAMAKGKDLEKPDLIQIKTTLAKIYLIRRDLETSAKFADEVINESPKNSDAHFTKGSIYLLKGDGSKAVSEFRSVVTENPKFAQAQIRLADAHLLNKEANLALDALKTAVKADPESRELLRGMARMLMIQKDFKQAEETLNKILAKNPADLEIKSDLGDMFVRSGDLKRAEAQYAELKRKAPELPIGYVKFSELYLKQGMSDKALNELEQAYKRNPGSWRVCNDLAYLLSEKSRSAGDLDRALTLAQKAQSLSPEELNVSDTLGWVYYKKGDFKRALELISKIQAVAPGSPIVNFHLGMAQYKSGMMTEAKNSLKKSLASGEHFSGSDEAAKIMKSL
jgi:tetratricopeptide (TPR) repeat protein